MTTATRPIGAAQVAPPRPTPAESAQCAHINAALAQLDAPAPRPGVAAGTVALIFGSGMATALALVLLTLVTMEALR